MSEIIPANADGSLKPQPKKRITMKPFPDGSFCQVTQPADDAPSEKCWLVINAAVEDQKEVLLQVVATFDDRHFANLLALALNVYVKAWLQQTAADAAKDKADAAALMLAATKPTMSAAEADPQVPEPPILVPGSSS